MLYSEARIVLHKERLVTYTTMGLLNTLWDMYVCQLTTVLWLSGHILLFGLALS